MSHSKNFLEGVSKIAHMLDHGLVDELASTIRSVRDRGGRLFILGVGGSAGNASHAVNDFRKLCNIEAYAPTDNVSELTARVNDDGWDSVFCSWLKVSKLNERDLILCFSVGGGSRELGVSVNLIEAVDFALEVGATVCGIVGRDGGYVKQKGHSVLVVPTVDHSLVTPHSEAFQAVVWHCIVSHPILQTTSTKW